MKNEMNQFNVPEKKENDIEIAFLGDLSGRRRFVRSGEKIYYVDPAGNREESSEELVQAAIEKHGYKLSEKEGS